MAFNDIYRLVVHQRLHGQEVINKFHFVCDDPTPGNRSAFLASDFGVNMDATIRGRAHVDHKFEYLEVQRIVPFGDGAHILNYAPNSGGYVNLGFNAGSGTLCEVITIYTAQAGRRKRGRVYLTGADTQSAQFGSWQAAQTTRTQAFATALATRYMAVPSPVLFYLGVWSRLIAGPTPPWPTAAFTRAISLTVRTTVRNQRRRQLGVGR